MANKSVPEPQRKEKLINLNVMISAKIKKQINAIGRGSPSEGTRYIFARFAKQIESLAAKAVEGEKNKNTSKRRVDK